MIILIPNSLSNFLSRTNSYLNAQTHEENWSYTSSRILAKTRQTQTYRQIRSANLHFVSYNFLLWILSGIHYCVRIGKFSYCVWCNYKDPSCEGFPDFMFTIWSYIGYLFKSMDSPISIEKVIIF